MRTEGGTPGRVDVGLPVQLVVGLVLVAGCWALFWTVVNAWTEIFFFGLWLGYALTVDGVVRLRTGTSILTRSAAQFCLLFGYSVPFWWMHEWFNTALHNWYYVEPIPHSEPVRVLLYSLCFSTALPALFESAELLRSTRLVDRPGRWRPLRRTPALLYGVSVFGVLLLTAVLVFPRQLFFLIWLCPLLVLDPVNTRLGFPSLWGQLARGRWQPLLALALGGLMCGFFWEMWNYWTVGAHWVYRLPAFLSHVHLFRMPMPGYLGYVPFAWSAYAYYQTLRGLLTPASVDPLGLE
ncbi:hypothetical protein [Streptomyces sp. RPT161]|uniref:hypothetical protein n=1 Tax=Streptomyces sp. RPT161 TaxID=3015993 RepID=UPI0022B8C704|nr:hypothetical protein [Streptomyces sp. RPT161]